MSVPRIDMNKETIFGLQNYRPKVRSNSTEWSSGGDLKSEAVSDSATLTPPASSSGFNNFSSSINTNIPAQQSLLSQSYSSGGNNGSSPSGSLPASPFSNSFNKDNHLLQTSSSTSSSSKKKDKSKQAEDEEDSRGIKALGSIFTEKTKLFFFLFLNKETIRVYDGNTSFRKKVFRTITVPKNCTYQTLLVCFFKLYFKIQFKGR